MYAISSDLNGGAQEFLKDESVNIVTMKTLLLLKSPFLTLKIIIIIKKTKHQNKKDKRETNKKSPQELLIEKSL